MSGIGKSSLSFKKIDSKQDRPISLGFKNLRFAHKFASSGLTDIDLTALTAPSELVALGFVNPNASDLAGANLAFFSSSLQLVSSINGPLIEGLSYDVISSTKIRLKNGAESQINEIIVGTITGKAQTGLISVDAFAINQTGTIAIGQTDIVVGDPFTWDKYSGKQVGDVLLFLDGILQMRNANNAVGVDGNYYEVAPSAGNLSNTLRLNNAVVGADKSYVVISNGLVAERPSAGVLAKVETLASSMDAVIQDLALVTGNPTANYQTAPNSVDLSVFGNTVKTAVADLAVITAAMAAPGFVRGVAYDETQAHTVLGAWTTGPASSPVNTDGTQVCTVTYTPKKIGNTILIEAQAYMCEETNVSDTGFIAVFKNADASALAAGSDPQAAYDSGQALSNARPHIQAKITISDLNPITFKLRAGGDSGAMSLNKQIGFPGSAAALFSMGNKLTTWLKVTEINT